jgi:signal transduction histidine kinase
VTTPEQQLIRRTARRITLQTAALFSVCLLIVAGLAALFILRAQNADGERQLRAAIADDDAVTDPPSGIVVYESSHGQVRSSPQLRGRPLDPTAFGAVEAGGPARMGKVTSGGRDYQLRTDRRGDDIVQAGLDLTVQNRERHRLIVALIAAGTAGLLIALAAGAYVARRAVRPLELASRRQRRFVADASHELRTPLTQAHTRAQLLQRSLAAAGDRPDLTDDAEQLVRSTRQLGDIIDELLLSAQLSADSAAPTPVDLGDLAREAVEAEQVRARPRQITITYENDGGDHVVAGSRTALRRVLNSLLDNALGHIEAGGAITVSVGREAGPTIRCRVTDDGRGFDPGDVDALFERFAHGDHGTGRRFGLGLALAREVIDAHGGTIGAGSTPGEGATFTVRLPAHAP